MNFHVVATNNEGGCCSITVEVIPKGSVELFKLTLVMSEANVTTSRNITDTVNTIKEAFGPELILMPVLLGWTLAKQCLPNPREFGDLKA